MSPQLSRITLQRIENLTHLMLVRCNDSEDKKLGYSSRFQAGLKQNRNKFLFLFSLGFLLFLSLPLEIIYKDPDRDIPSHTTKLKKHLKDLGNNMLRLKIQNYSLFFFFLLASIFFLLGLGMVREGYGLHRMFLKREEIRKGGCSIGRGENKCAKPQGYRRLLECPNG